MSNCEQETCTTQKSDAQKTECPATNAVLSDCCPVEWAATKWVESFPCAMKETFVDILKDKIKKTWGGHLEKEADIVVQTMGAMWQAKLAEGKAKSELHEGFKKLYEQAAQGKK